MEINCFAKQSIIKQLVLSITHSIAEKKINSKHYFVYIVTNRYHNFLYTGVPNDLQRRIEEHKTGLGGKFAGKYRCDKLVFYERTEDINCAIEREKQIKAGTRQKKVDLINGINADWVDLSEELFA